MSQMFPLEVFARPHAEQMRSQSVAYRTTEQVVLLSLCIVGALGLMPFVFMHLTAGRFEMDFFTIGLIVVNVSLSVHVWRNRTLKYTGVVFAVVYMSAILASMHYSGPSIVYWAYPAMAIAYFFLPIMWAVAINATVMVLMLPLLAPALPNIEVFRIIASLAILNVVACVFARRMIDHRELLVSLATRDPLTGAGNRRALKTRLREMVAVHDRRGGRMTLAILDVDYFKQINDQLGHARGDQVLVELAEIIQERVRLTDHLYRFGGDEFVILLGDTDIDNAARICGQLRERVEASAEQFGHRVTLSIGLAELAEEESEDAWLQRADVALYRAKTEGRNRCRVG